MSAIAENLRELHGLHQRAKGLRDRLASGPKTLAARETFLAKRQAAIEEARKALKDLQAQTRNREVQLQSMQDKVADLRVKLNQTKKQTDYEAIRNQIAHDNASIARTEDDVLAAMTKIDEHVAALAAQEAEVKALAAEVAQARADWDAKVQPMKQQLSELDTAITTAEDLIPGDQREQYRRVVKQRGAEAMAHVEITDSKKREEGACSGCFVTITSQMMNELRLSEALVFCKSCGCVLYLAEEEVNHLRRAGA